MQNAKRKQIVISLAMPEMQMKGSLGMNRRVTLAWREDGEEGEAQTKALWSVWIGELEKACQTVSDAILSPLCPIHTKIEVVK